ncbi:MAG: BglG family transcription antiterminator [Dictyoglomaceae bacterium]
MGKRDRKEKILKLLLESSQPIKVEEIAEKTRYSLSTIRRELRNLEDYLYPYGIELKTIPYKGVCLTNFSGKSYNEIFSIISLQEKISIKERQRLMVLDLLLSHEKITLENWEEKFKVSHPTVIKDFKEVKKWIIKHNLSIIAKPHYGIKVEGEERFKRQALLDLILENLSEEEKGKLLNEVLSSYKVPPPWGEVFPISFLGAINFFNEIERQWDIKFTDDSFLQLLLITGITVNRIIQRFRIETINLEDFDLSPPYKILEDFYKINFCEEERRFLNLYIFSSELESGKSLLKEDKKLKNILEKEIFSSYSFRNNTLKLFLFHLQNAIFKIRNDITIHNPMLEKIKRNYPILYHISSELSELLSQRLNINIPEEEKGYITLHLVRILEKLAKKKKIIVICPSGVLTANILAEKIKKILDKVEIVGITSVRDLPKIPHKGFIYVSTIPLSDFKSPYLLISPFFSQEEGEKLKKYIYDFYKEKVSINVFEIKDENELTLYISETFKIIPIRDKIYWIFSKEEPCEEKFFLFKNLKSKSFYIYLNLFDPFKTIWFSQEILFHLSLKKLNKINKDYLAGLFYSMERGIEK